MTGLGASIYVGFFALAALWLFLTSDGPLTRDPDDQTQRPDRSNSTSTSAMRTLCRQSKRRSAEPVTFFKRTA